MSLPQIAIIRTSDASKTLLPFYGNPVGTSMTLLAANINPIKIAPNHYQLIETGLAIALPVGLEAQIRSLKQSNETGVYVMNAPLTIDASDRCEIKVCLYNASTQSVLIKSNDPIALLVFSPALRVQWNDLNAVTLQQKEPAVVLSEQTQDKPVEDNQQSTDTQQTAVDSAVQDAQAEKEKQPKIVKEFEELENRFYNDHQQENNLTDKDTSDHA